mgnify:CR=1 FL=1
MKFKKQGFNKLSSFALAFTFHFTIKKLISVFLLKAEIQIKISVLIKKILDNILKKTEI